MTHTARLHPTLNPTLQYPTAAPSLRRLGPAVQHAVFPVDQDALVAAVAAAARGTTVCPLASSSSTTSSEMPGSTVTVPPPLGRHAGRRGAADVLDAGGVAGRLHVHAEVDQVHQHLHVPLRLHVAAHHAEARTTACRPW